MAKKKSTKKNVHKERLNSSPQKKALAAQIEYLEILIEFSLRAITLHGNDIDDFFAQQAQRLQLKLKELRG